MTAVRMVVDDVDSTIASLAPAGYEVAQRWGPPFAIMTPTAPDRGPDIWVSGPQSSAAASTSMLPTELQRVAAVRLVAQVDDVAAGTAAFEAAGWTVLTNVVSGPGGSQLLVGRDELIWEVFAAG